MSESFVHTDELPFCKGCGHHRISKDTDTALRRLGLRSPRDVVLVTDIGCVGVVDRHFQTHTVHGLHGRSVALATGIALALGDTGKKVMAFIGDGGATIGMQHLLEAAHKNVNLTVVVHNNMLYGMTGGQPSGLTPRNFNTAIRFDAAPEHGYDLCRIMEAAGAPYARRVIGIGDLSDALTEAFAVRGFSLIEIVEICPSHGVKRNPGRRLPDILAEAGIAPDRRVREDETPPFFVEPRKTESLLDELRPVDTAFESPLKGRFSIVLAGSAGEGVQSAAGMLAHAAMASGLWATLKGSYPVTVGIGFSTAEVILSSEPILYTGIETPDALLVVSADGLAHRRGVLEQMEKGWILADASLALPPVRAETVTRDFRSMAGPRSAALAALFELLRRRPVVSPDALIASIEQSKLGARLDTRKLAGLP